MKLTELIEHLAIAQIQGNADVDITGISMNSKDFDDREEAKAAIRNRNH
ncbi:MULTISPECIES: hypothetical protein [Paenibacillus]|nr:hypothetical protein [Paenibacillus sp. IHBB 10380]